MNRVPYRRVTGSVRAGSGSTYRSRQSQPTTITQAETIILQCIISGIILVAVLLIGLVDAAPTATFREAIRTTMTGANTISELTADIRNFGEEFLGWENSAPMVEFPIIPLPETPFPTMQVPQHQYHQPQPDQPLTAYDEPLNPQIPGPSATPGLWD